MRLIYIDIDANESELRGSPTLADALTNALFRATKRIDDSEDTEGEVNEDS